MADVTEMTTFENAEQAISLGKRHLLVRDYSMAVIALAQGCSMLAEQHGEKADELGEPFLLYGRALLCLSREETGVLGSGVPGTDEADEDGEDGGEEADGDEEEGDEEDEASNAEKEKKEASGEAKPTEEETTKSSTENKPEEKKEDSETNNESTASAPSSSTESISKEIAGSSKKEKLTNGVDTAHLNGDSHENGEEEAEDVENEDDDDESSNLQLAWEVLELAKLILLKRGPPGWKLLAEAHRLLGEVAMESGNQPGALTDLNACLDLLRRIEPPDTRSMAETHYQLGLAHSLNDEFDASIEQFKEATNLLEGRIKELEAITDPPKIDDLFYSVEGEIKELKELLPEIQEKISDMHDFKQLARKLVVERIEAIKNKMNSFSNGAGPSGESSSSSSVSAASKSASDISHLVRKKKRTEDDEPESASPCKKPTPDKSA